SRLGWPEFGGDDRARTGLVLVLRGRIQSLCLRPGPWLRFGDLAVPAMPRMEQHNPPLVLVVREHAEQTAEARRVISENPSVQAAIDLRDHSRDVGRPVRGQEGNQVGDLL